MGRDDGDIETVAEQSHDDVRPSAAADDSLEGDFVEIHPVVVGGGVALKLKPQGEVADKLAGLQVVMIMRPVVTRAA